MVMSSSQGCPSSYNASPGSAGNPNEISSKTRSLKIPKPAAQPTLFPSLQLIKQPPALHLKCRPDPGRVLDRIPNQLSLLAQRQVHLLLIVLALDVRHVDGDEDVALLLLEPYQREDQRREVGRRRPPRLVGARGGLRRDERVGGYALAIRRRPRSAFFGQVGGGGSEGLRGRTQDG